MKAKRINFTKAAIEALPLPESKSTLYYDQKVRGLAIRVFASGRKNFVLYKRMDGNPIRLSLGAFPDVPIEFARLRAQEMSTDIAKGANPSKQRQESRETLTLEAAFELYLNDYAKQRCKTWKDMSDNFKRYLWHLRKRKLNQLSRADVQALINKLGRERGCTTANRVLQLLRAVINKMKSWDFYDGNNPAQGISKFKEVSRERFLQPDEIPRFFQSVSQEKPLIRDYILMCLLTGARKSRVAEMRWEQINFEAATWRIPGELEKNGKEHIVPLVPKALEILERCKSQASSEWVYPGAGKTGHLVSPKNAWLRVKKRAGLDDLHMHDLRRSLGSWQAATGASLAVIGRSLNHKDIKTTLVYARLNLDPIRQSMEAATSALLKAAEPKPDDDGPTPEPPLKLVKRHRRTVGA